MEQLKFNISSHNQNVKVVGWSGYHLRGPTHHGIQNLFVNLIEFEAPISLITICVM